MTEQEASLPVALPPAPDALAMPAIGPGLAERVQLAKLLATGTGVLPARYSNRPGNILAAILAADALRIPVWTALQELWIAPGGKVAISALLMRGLMAREGCTVTVEATQEVATVKVERPGGQKGSATFTTADAEQAGLNGGSWRKYPRAMLVARATVIVAREVCPDLLIGAAYTPDELGGPASPSDLEGDPS